MTEVSTEPEVHGRATTASIDRRVERLEERVDRVERGVDRIELNVVHAAELHKARFDTIDANSLALSVLVTALAARFDTAATESARMSGDPSSTPAGRQIVGDIAVLKVSAETSRSGIESIKRQNAYWAGGLAVLVALANLFGPTIARALNLPT